MTNEQIRNGEVVRESSVEVWEFDQNGNVPIQQDVFQIFPGDSFRTNCYYRGTKDTTFGLGSQEGELKITCCGGNVKIARRYRLCVCVCVVTPRLTDCFPNAEMCIVFAYYYPAMRASVNGVSGIPWHCGYDEPGLEACWVEHDAVPLTSENQLNREFGFCNVSNDETKIDDSIQTSGSLIRSASLFTSVVALFFSLIWL